MSGRHDRWEYHIETTAHPEVARLNALGADGWELVAVHPDGSLLFKRLAPNLRERITLAQRAAVAASSEDDR
jgi:hypothetical protein